jgi:hypothetical protein
MDPTNLLVLGVCDGLGKVGQRVAHLGGRNIGRGVLESLRSVY